MSFFNSFYQTLANAQKNVSELELQYASDMILDVSNNKGKIIVVGNGGSAAIASHLAIDFVKSAQIESICFNESSLLTCYSNDYGYENWVKEALKSYAKPEDLLIAISSSGESENILNGVHYAIKQGMIVLTFSGFCADNSLRKYGKLNFWVDSCSYNIIELTHETWLLSIVDYLAHLKVNNYASINIGSSI